MSLSWMTFTTPTWTPYILRVTFMTPSCQPRKTSVVFITPICQPSLYVPEPGRKADGRHDVDRKRGIAPHDFGGRVLALEIQVGIGSKRDG